MVVRKNFSKGATLTFCLPHPGCWRCNPNVRSQIALPSLHHKEIPHVMVTVTKMHFFGSEIYYDNLQLHNKLYADYQSKHFGRKPLLQSGSNQVFSLPRDARKLQYWGLAYWEHSLLWDINSMLEWGSVQRMLTFRQQFNFSALMICVKHVNYMEWWTQA